MHFEWLWERKFQQTNPPSHPPPKTTISNSSKIFLDLPSIVAIALEGFLKQERRRRREREINRSKERKIKYFACFASERHCCAALGISLAILVVIVAVVIQSYATNKKYVVFISIVLERVPNTYSVTSFGCVIKHPKNVERTTYVLANAYPIYEIASNCNMRWIQWLDFQHSVHICYMPNLPINSAGLHIIRFPFTSAFGWLTGVVQFPIRNTKLWPFISIHWRRF